MPQYMISLDDVETTSIPEGEEAEFGYDPENEEQQASACRPDAETVRMAEQTRRQRI